ncbi:MAG: DUF6273 domain-containing protein [Lachnospiraceae bacterium]|nr:DUF6273 domain-containing protein [Lachnospiraceae bacterium]
MKKNLLVVSAAAVLGLAFIISGCHSTRHDSPKDAVKLTDASVGDIVVFGDIRWYVIAKTETEYTLLSEKPVIKQCFRKAGYGITTSTWEESTVRAWLNDKFYNTFTEEEKALIVKMHNINADSSEYGTSGGNDTDDHIYLLSVDEANALDNSVRKCGPWDSPFHQWWWLRSPGANTSYVAYVGKGKDGVIDPNGDIASNGYGAVRPALNLSLAGHTVPTSINRTSEEVESELKAISDSQIDDVVVFGRYTWYVTNKTDGICTLLCQGPVAYMPYNDSSTDITWENCSLRRWLNEDFYNSKFSDGEKAAIITSYNTFIKDDSKYGMDCGNDTDDKVYLFSYSEAMAVSDDTRDCGVDWWLRSPGKTQNNAVFIGLRSPNLMGTEVSYDFAVRPAIRVSYGTNYMSITESEKNE